MNDSYPEGTYEEYQRKMKWLVHCYIIYTSSYVNNGFVRGNMIFGTFLPSIKNLLFLSLLLSEILEEEKYEQNCIDELSNLAILLEKIVEYCNEFMLYSRKVFKDNKQFNDKKIMMSTYKDYVLELERGKMPPVVKMREELKKVWNKL